ncbi:30S ribosomal protein S1 [compost metagenome]
MHISALSEKFIKDPREAVKAGDVVKVKVMEVDIPRKRVGLSMRMSDTPGEKIDGARGARPGSAPRQSQNTAPRKETTAATPSNNAMASLFANAKQLKKR